MAGSIPLDNAGYKETIGFEGQPTSFEEVTLW